MTAKLLGASGKAEEGPFPIPASYLRVHFRTQCVAGQAYLLIEDEAGRAEAFHQMEEGDKGCWHLITRLKGSHRYRYYADDGAMTTKSQWTEVDDAAVRTEGLYGSITRTWP